MLAICWSPRWRSCFSPLLTFQKKELNKAIETRAKKFYQEEVESNNTLEKIKSLPLYSDTSDTIENLKKDSQENCKSIAESIDKATAKEKLEKFRVQLREKAEKLFISDLDQVNDVESLNKLTDEFENKKYYPYLSFFPTDDKGTYPHSLIQIKEILSLLKEKKFSEFERQTEKFKKWNEEHNNSYIKSNFPKRVEEIIEQKIPIIQKSEFSSCISEIKDNDIKKQIEELHLRIECESRLDKISTNNTECRNIELLLGHFKKNNLENEYSKKLLDNISDNTLKTEASSLFLTRLNNENKNNSAIASLKKSFKSFCDETINNIYESRIENFTEENFKKQLKNDTSEEIFTIAKDLPDYQKIINRLSNVETDDFKETTIKINFKKVNEKHQESIEESVFLQYLQNTKKKEQIYPLPNNLSEYVKKNTDWKSVTEMLTLLKTDKFWEAEKKSEKIGNLSLKKIAKNCIQSIEESHKNNLHNLRIKYFFNDYDTGESIDIIRLKLYYEHIRDDESVKNAIGIPTESRKSQVETLTPKEIDETEKTKIKNEINKITNHDELEKTRKILAFISQNINESEITSAKETIEELNLENSDLKTCLESTAEKFVEEYTLLKSSINKAFEEMILSSKNSNGQEAMIFSVNGQEITGFEEAIGKLSELELGLGIKKPTKEQVKNIIKSIRDYKTLESSALGDKNFLNRKRDSLRLDRMTKSSKSQLEKLLVKKANELLPKATFNRIGEKITSNLTLGQLDVVLNEQNFHPEYTEPELEVNFHENILKGLSNYSFLKTLLDNPEHESSQSNGLEDSVKIFKERFDSYKNRPNEIKEILDYFNKKVISAKINKDNFTIDDTKFENLDTAIDTIAKEIMEQDFFQKFKNFREELDIKNVIKNSGDIDSQGNPIFTPYDQAGKNQNRKYYQSAQKILDNRFQNNETKINKEIGKLFKKDFESYIKLLNQTIETNNNIATAFTYGTEFLSFQDLFSKLKEGYKKNLKNSNKKESKPNENIDYLVELYFNGSNDNDYKKLKNIFEDFSSQKIKDASSDIKSKKIKLIVNAYLLPQRQKIDKIINTPRTEPQDVQLDNISSATLAVIYIAIIIKTLVNGMVNFGSAFIKSAMDLCGYLGDKATETAKEIRLLVTSKYSVFADGTRTNSNELPQTGTDNLPLGNG